MDGKFNDQIRCMQLLLWAGHWGKNKTEDVEGKRFECSAVHFNETSFTLIPMIHSTYPAIRTSNNHESCQVDPNDPFSISSYKNIEEPWNLPNWSHHQAIRTSKNHESLKTPVIHMKNQELDLQWFHHHLKLFVWVPTTRCFPIQILNCHLRRSCESDEACHCIGCKCQSWRCPTKRGICGKSGEHPMK